MESEVLDHTLCQEMAKYVEELTTSGRPALNPDIMKSFKKICRVSSLYCEQAYHLLITQLEKGHSEIRLSAFQMIEELFNRSHCFRELLISNFQHFLELTVETDYDNPLPPPKTASDLLKSSAYSAIQKWYDKFGEEYKRLTLGFNFLKTCKKVDFNGIRSRTELQQRQEKEKDEKLKKIAEERMEKTLQQMNEMLEDIKNTITEAKTGFQLILPSPDDFFIETGENDTSSIKKSGVENSKTETCSVTDGESSACLVVDKVTTTTKNDLTSCSNSNQPECEMKDSSDLEINNVSTCKNDNDNISGKLTSNNESENCCDDLPTGDKTNSSFIKGSNSVNNESESDENCSGNEVDDDCESDEEENVLQEHGLHSFKYNLSIDMTPGVVSLQETDDNKDLLQTLKDHYRLIVTKYKPTVNKWIQNLTKYGDKEDLTKSVIDVKTDLDSLLSKYNEMNIIPDDKPVEMGDDSDDDFEEVPEKEGYEPIIPPHKRAEYGLEPLPTSTRSETVTQHPKASTSRNTSGFWSLSKTIDQKPENDPTTMKANFVRLLQQSSGTSATATCTQSKPKVPLTVTGDSQKDKLLEKAPIVPYGVDLEHWENPDKMEAPLVVKYDWLNTVWAYTERDNGESKADQDGLAALKNRSISFVGKFEPVKWKCRAPLPNGKFCERMDRFKCPFHGKIIARNDSGQPTDPKDIASLSSQHDDIDITSNDQSYWRDPELEADIEAALGIDLGSSKGKKKGKGKGKGKQKKYPNLTDITEVKNTSRNRLEKKIFKRSTMKRVAADLDELDNKKARDKFGNQFVYQMSQR
ncbi:UVSSA [Mytilus coruscus]|uniref:UVSSA n=1 Tax=Mytilus coruscus TaxID=42192 RepID=A0A6J8CAT2_MYTCO|nr:UVSSA [Mytilus coruscus]